MTVAGRGAPSLFVGRMGSERLVAVALRISGDGAREDQRLVLIGEHGSDVQCFGPFAEEDVVATWRSLGAATGLPLRIEAAGEILEDPCRRGPVGEERLHRDRRSLKLLAGRRPRFLVRRKIGRPTSDPATQLGRAIATGSAISDA